MSNAKKERGKLLATEKSMKLRSDQSNRKKIYPTGKGGSYKIF